VVIITGAGGSGVLLSDACVDNGLSLMTMPPDLDAAFRKFIPPFGAAGNPVDITGGEPPSPTRTRSSSAWKIRVSTRSSSATGTPSSRRRWSSPSGRGEEGDGAKGIEKPIVASLAGDVQVEEAAEYLYEHGVPAYAYSTEIPVAVLGAKYKWARGAGKI
jgi:acyl-CoA synthetase (NDP forming)